MKTKDEAWLDFVTMPVFRPATVEMLKDWGDLIPCHDCDNPECNGWHFKGIYVDILADLAIANVRRFA